MILYLIQRVEFQSTLPARGATHRELLMRRCAGFQSTLPARGATPWGCTSNCMGYFNPRSPHGERRNACSNFHRPHCISIHAPRTGSDGVKFCFNLPHVDFNPRSPHGERLSWGRASNCMGYFNPRSPHGERPVIWVSVWARRYYFNPRSPHGERPIVTPAAAAQYQFQSTLPARGAT